MTFPNTTSWLFFDEIDISVLPEVLRFDLFDNKGCAVTTCDYLYHKDTTSEYSRGIVIGGQSSQIEQTRNETWNVNYVYVNNRVVRESDGTIIETYNTSSDYSGSGSFEQNTETTTSERPRNQLYIVYDEFHAYGYFTGTRTSTSELSYSLDESGSQSNQETVITSWRNQANSLGNLIYSASATAIITSSANANYTYQYHTYSTSSYEGEYHDHGVSDSGDWYTVYGIDGTWTEFSESGTDIFVSESFSRNVTETLAAQSGVNSSRFVQTSIDGGASASGTSYSNSFSSSDRVIDSVLCVVDDYNLAPYATTYRKDETARYCDYYENDSTSTASYNASVKWGQNPQTLQNHTVGSGTSDRESGYSLQMDTVWTYEGYYGGGAADDEWHDLSGDVTSNHSVTIAPYNKTVSTTGFGQGKAAVSSVSIRYSGFSVNPEISHNISGAITSSHDPGTPFYSYYDSYYAGSYPGYCSYGWSDLDTVPELTFGKPNFNHYNAVDAETLLNAKVAERETPPPVIAMPNPPVADGISPPINDSMWWAVTKGAGSSLKNGVANIVVGGYSAIKEGAFTIVDIGGVGADWVATLAGHPIGWEELSAQGKSYQNSHGLDIATNAARAGLASGTLGVSEILIGTYQYAQDGDTDAFQQHMGGVAAGNLAAAGSIKLGQTLKTDKGTFIDQMSQEEATRYKGYWHDPKLNQYTPGTRELSRTQLSNPSSKTQYTYKSVSHFDEYGRLVGETHYSTHPSTGLTHPLPHHHRTIFSSEFPLGRRLVRIFEGMYEQ